MISGRRKFQKVYDLTERVLPPGLDVSPPDADEAARFIVRRTVAADGLIATRPNHTRWAFGKREAIAQALQELVANGEIAPVEVEGLDGEPYYVLTAALADVESHAPLDPRAHILSPFDNLVIQRSRLKTLFGFDYTIECYLPAEKRKYGYFTLPILWGDRFVGRMDAKAERKSKTLIAHSIIFEGDLGDERLLPALGEKLRAFAAFCGCREVVIGAPSRRSKYRRASLLAASSKLALRDEVEGTARRSKSCRAAFQVAHSAQTASLRYNGDYGLTRTHLPGARLSGTRSDTD